MNKAPRIEKGAQRLPDDQAHKVVQDFVHRSTTGQGLSEKVQDAATLRRAAQLMKPGS